MPDRPPFDPVRGAWIVLLSLVGGLILNSAFLFVECGIFLITVSCERAGSNIKDVTLEVITATALLITAAQSRK